MYKSKILSSIEFSVLDQNDEKVGKVNQQEMEMNEENKLL